MEISQRKKKILAALVELYIETAEPVGSKVLAQRAGLGCSSATIRNELAELSAMGYLNQPHTSAGRVPTVQGYRLYVNELMERQRLSAEETERLNRELAQRLMALDNLVSDIGQFASQITDLPALAIAAPRAVTIVRFDFIYVDVNTFIMVALLSDNSVKNKLIRLPVSVEKLKIDKLSTLMNANFTGLREDQITQPLISATERALDDMTGLTAVAASFAIEALTQASQPGSFVGGQNRLLHHPEYQDPDKAHALMSFLNQAPMEFPQLMNGETGVKVIVGPENVSEALRDSSVVLATYDAGDGVRGVVGVVGPTRMDYAVVAGKMQLIAQTISNALGTGGLKPPSGMDNKLMIRGEDTIE
ncbi:MAG: heat-inducible transcription repressor HrcA [Oscillospiraceae bacterium]|nr:heat-inducible transcription repressor HrcA [Oscillospiraceae bacterium]